MIRTEQREVVSNPLFLNSPNYLMPYSVDKLPGRYINLANLGWLRTLDIDHGTIGVDVQGRHIKVFLKKGGPPLLFRDVQQVDRVKAILDQEAGK